MLVDKLKYTNPNRNKFKTTYRQVMRCYHKLFQTISEVLMSVDRLKYTNPNRPLFELFMIYLSKICDLMVQFVRKFESRVVIVIADVS